MRNERIKYFVTGVKEGLTDENFPVNKYITSRRCGGFSFRDYKAEDAGVSLGVALKGTFRTIINPFPIPNEIVDPQTGEKRIIKLSS